VNKITGGSIPREYIPAVDHGSRSRWSRACSPYPLVDVRATLIDGTYHEVDSSEMAFKIAGSMALKGLAQGRPGSCSSPSWSSSRHAPEDFMGDVMGDITSRRVGSSGSTTERHEGRRAWSAGRAVRLRDDLRVADPGRASHNPMQLHATTRSARSRRRSSRGSAASKPIQDMRSRSSSGPAHVNIGTMVTSTTQDHAHRGESPRCCEKGQADFTPFDETTGARGARARITIAIAQSSTRPTTATTPTSDCPATPTTSEHDHRRRQMDARSWWSAPPHGPMPRPASTCCSPAGQRPVHRGGAQQIDMVDDPSCWTWSSSRSASCFPPRVPGDELPVVRLFRAQGARGRREPRPGHGAVEPATPTIPSRSATPRSPS